MTIPVTLQIRAGDLTVGDILINRREVRSTHRWGRGRTVDIEFTDRGRGITWNTRQLVLVDLARHDQMMAEVREQDHADALDELEDRRRADHER